MASIIVKNRVCEACGTDVRSGSLFCYHCGESVDPKPEAQVIDDKEDTNRIQFPNDNDENNDKNGNEPHELKPEEIKIGTHSEISEEVKKENVSEKTVEIIEEIKVKNTGVHEQAKLKSAASLRRKSKIVQRKKVEIVWEEHENAPNAWFIVAAIILTGLAAGILYLAMHLR